MRRLIILTGLAVAASCGGCSVPDTSSTAISGNPSGIPAADAQTGKAVSAANAFLATLDEAQKKAVLFDFTDAAQRRRWSNLPDKAAQRLGLRWGDLNEAQRKALMGLLGAVLSPEGVRNVVEQMDADDVVRTGPLGQPVPGRPPVNFGTDYYFVSFVGAPSTTAPWMLQFGGHHLAINATVVGPNITLSPTLTGGQPLKYTKDGKAIYIAEREAREGSAMLASLTPTQRAKAVLGTERIDLVLGPGHDGQRLQPEGIAASAMTDSQKALLLSLIEARLGMLNADDLAARMAEIRTNLNQTYFAWYGPADTLGAAYFRVTGPTVVIEYAPQDRDGDPADHAHNMYRDPTNEYGTAWTAVK